MALIKSIKKLYRQFFPKTDKEIYPDEIFLDSSNLPQFDTAQFEGRLEKPISKRTVVFLGFVFLLVGIVFSGKMWMLQVEEGGEYRALSENNRLQHSLIFADRGVVFDRNGEELVWNVESDEQEFSERAYSERTGLSHVLGYIQYPLKDTAGIYYQQDFIGKAGVERFLGEILDGENGLKIIETDALGEIQSESVLQPPRNGKNLTLSIDARIQNKLFESIRNTAENVGFKGGAGVLMDVKTGEILALSSFPEYNSQVLTRGVSETIQRYQNDSRKPFLNRAVSGLYTPGSIIKPFIALGALEEEIITPEKKILSTGSISIPHPYFEDKESVFSDWKAHGFVSMREAIAHSSNVYFYTIGGGYEDQKGLGIATIEKYVRAFGFGDETGIQLSLEEDGTIPNPSWKKEHFEDGVWRIGDTYNTAIGQYGFQVTPIQVARAVSAIANGGKLLVPTLVFDDAVAARTLPIAKGYFKVVQEGMRLSVTEGTANGLYLPQVNIAAKTGTAELGSAKQFVNSWVIGFFPYDAPRYAFAVIMERGPQGNLIGGVFVMRELLEWMSIYTPEYLRSVES